jgi:acyl-CoA synthetase (AMP-forming)/AMP-acid ligase II
MPGQTPTLVYEPTMPVVVRRAAKEFGDDDFIVLKDRRISFRQAEVASRHLAKQLLAAGAGKGTRLGIHLPTGPEWAVAWIAAARIGALAMPFSTVYRPAELRGALRMGDVSLLLATTTLLGKDHVAYLEEAIPGLAEHDGSDLRLEALPYLRSIRFLGGPLPVWAEPFAISDQDPAAQVSGIGEGLLEAVESEVRPADLLTAVFTSGTTATPKAVLHTHGGILRKSSPVANAGLGATFPGRVLTYMPFFWVGGMQNVVGALQSGAAVLAQERLDPVQALALAEREKATSVNGNANTLRSAASASGRSFGDLKSIKPFPRRPWEGGPSSRGDTPIPLGMTETFGIWAAVDGFEMRVLDTETGEILPEGQEGEFMVRGYGLMQGIYKREREDTFTPDGFYRTGDRGYLEDGLVYFQGRMTEMIKTKGANVAPLEVEAVLNSYPEVHMALVVGLPHEVFGQEVAAAIVAADGHAIDLEAVLARARKELSPYKVPTYAEVVGPDELIWTSTSKVDKRAMSELLARRRADHAGMGAARTSKSP